MSSSESPEQKLWNAANDGDLQTVIKITQDDHVDVNYLTGNRGDGPLHRACRNGKADVVRHLLKNRRVDPNKGNSTRGDTPFFSACQHGHVGVVSILLADHRIDVNKEMKDGVTPFYIACQNGHLEIVDLLLADRRIDFNEPQNHEVSPFYIACQNGHVDVLARLLANPKIDVNQPNKNDATPFYIACQNANLPVVTLLLSSQRVDVNMAQNQGATPCFIACQNGHLSVVKLLLRDQRVDFNRPKNDNCTPLWIASQNGHLEVVRAILASGREVSTKMRSAPGFSPWNDTTAAEIAEENDHPEIVKLLEEFVEDPLQTTEDLTRDIDAQEFRTYCEEGDLEGVQRLEQKYGPSPLSLTDQRTLLHLACEFGDPAVVSELLRGSLLSVCNEKDSEGKTPFYLACEKGHREVVAIMLQRPEVEMGHTDLNGKTFLAAATGHTETLRLLFQSDRVKNFLDGKLEQTGERSRRILELKGKMKEISSIPFYTFLQMKPDWDQSFTVRGFRFSFPVEGKAAGIQEVLFVSLNGLVFFGMVCEEYPGERKAYLSFLEKRGRGPSFGKPLLQEYARFLSVRYPKVDLHIWADPPKVGENYIFRNSPPPPPKITRRASSGPAQKERSLLMVYMKYLREYVPEDECKEFQVPMIIPSFPVFFSKADKKFKEVERAILGLSKHLGDLINLHFRDTLICQISGGVVLPPETLPIYPYLSQDFFKNSKFDFSDDEKTRESQAVMFEELEKHGTTGRLGTQVSTGQEPKSLPTAVEEEEEEDVTDVVALWHQLAMKKLSV